eukprot:9447571-Pyramimonas_sp.AAC.1
MVDGPGDGVRPGIVINGALQLTEVPGGVAARVATTAVLATLEPIRFADRTRVVRNGVLHDPCTAASHLHAQGVRHRHGTRTEVHLREHAGQDALHVDGAALHQPRRG